MIIRKILDYSKTIKKIIYNDRESVYSARIHIRRLLL